MANAEIRIEIMKSGLRYYQVAELLGISTYHFSRMMQRELKPEKKELILEVLAQNGNK